MILVTYLGPRPSVSRAGIRLQRDVPLPLPDDLAAPLVGNPSFLLDAGDAPEPVAAPKRGRPRKA